MSPTSVARGKASRDGGDCSLGAVGRPRQPRACVCFKILDGLVEDPLETVMREEERLEQWHRDPKGLHNHGRSQLGGRFGELF